MIRVIVADDQQLIRAGFRALLDAEPDIDVVAEASTGGETVELVRRHRPDVVLMDIRMPGGDGLEATERIRADPSLGSTKVVVVTTFELDEYVTRALRAGAVGFLVKDAEPTDLIRAVRVAHEGEALLSPSIARRVIEGVELRPRRTELVAGLTDRERGILSYVGRGLTNAEIGDALFLSPLTVKTHVSRMMGKLGARDRVRLVIVAYEAGLVDPDHLPRE
ncbi:response regulator transcription factor [Microbacterium chocolatum]|uniref:response regulator transcription factor n=1 Tax=Microbacterium aurantiacum TaxID=162393 RepID=UPI00338F7A71